MGVLPNMDYDLIEVEVGRGDRIFLTSDGITECTNAEGKQFGMERLAPFLEEHSESSLKGLLSALKEELRGWAGSNEFQDDLSMLAMEIL